MSSTTIFNSTNYVATTGNVTQAQLTTALSAKVDSSLLSTTAVASSVPQYDSSANLTTGKIISSKLIVGNTTQNKTLVLYDTNGANPSASDYYGYALESGTIRYNVDGSSAKHIFSRGIASGTAFTPMLTINGNGVVTTHNNSTSAIQNTLDDGSGKLTTSKLIVGNTGQSKAIILYDNAPTQPTFTEYYGWAVEGGTFRQNVDVSGSKILFSRGTPSSTTFTSLLTLNGTGVVTTHKQSDSSVQNTLDDGSGNMTVAGTLNLNGATFAQFPNVTANQDKLLGTNPATSALEMRSTTTGGSAFTIVKTGTAGVITAGSGGFVTSSTATTITGDITTSNPTPQGASSHITIRGASNNAQNMLIGYNTTANEGYIQCVQQGVINTPLRINSGGGYCYIGQVNFSGGNISSIINLTATGTINSGVTGYTNAYRTWVGVSSGAVAGQYILGGAVGTNPTSVNVYGGDSGGQINITVGNTGITANSAIINIYTATRAIGSGTTFSAGTLSTAGLMSNFFVGPYSNGFYIWNGGSAIASGTVLSFYYTSIGF